MSKARAHHYIPVFYLKGFTSSAFKDKGYLWVYEKNKPVRKSTPPNEAHERDFYAFIDEEGVRQELETKLSQIESLSAPLFQAIADGHHRFSREEFEGIATFMALLWVRGPFGRELVQRISEETMKKATKEYAQDEKLFKAKYKEFLKQSGTETELSAEEMRSFILSDNWGASQESYGYTLRRMFEGWPKVIDLLEAKSWDVLLAESGQFFCTSDFPVLTILPEHGGVASIGAGFAMPGVRIYFPLSKRICLVLKDAAPPSRRLVRGVVVREINKFLMVGARRFLYHCEKNAAMEKLFNKIGCKSIPGVNAFMREPPPPGYPNR
jgi:Protein of unknown function (DUF4238)